MTDQTPNTTPSTVDLLNAALDARCKREGIQPSYVDFDNNRMTLDVGSFMATAEGQQELTELTKASEGFDHGQPIVRMNKRSKGP